MAQQRVLLYRYKPLPDQRSIRLLELHRESGVEGLRCSTKDRLARKSALIHSSVIHLGIALPRRP